MEEAPGAGRRRVLAMMLLASWLCWSLITQLVGEAEAPESRMVVVRDTMPVVSRSGGDNATLVVSFFNAETRDRNSLSGR
jgi:hypothetical protein